MGKWHKRSTPKLRAADPKLEADVASKAHGLARDLVKLIANLTAKNKANQDLVRLKEVASIHACTLSTADTEATAIGHSSCFIPLSARRP